MVLNYWEGDFLHEHGTNCSSKQDSESELGNAKVPHLQSTKLVNSLVTI